MDEIKRLTPAQRARCNRLIRRLCANYDGGAASNIKRRESLDFRGFLRAKRVRANYLTSAFPKFLEDHGLRRMRFHDLRHSCASLLLANGVPLKHIQEWLGHSDFTTTANIYAHLDYKSKITSA